ncbi:MAG: hypothetical protein WEC34_09425 [Acidimicrobiia bacterium]
MRVLVVGTLPDAVERVDRELRAAGHEIVRCHDAAESAFPCAALRDARACPLEGPPVDVAVTVRDQPWHQPSPFEDGAVCALRRHIPLVTVDAAVNPFGAWSRRDVTGEADLAAVCEEVADAPLPHHGAVATDIMVEVIERAGLDPAGASAVVHRRRGVLKVTIDLPDAAAPQRGNIGSRIITALRELDPRAPGIDVGVAAT